MAEIFAWALTRSYGPVPPSWMAALAPGPQRWFLPGVPSDAAFEGSVEFWIDARALVDPPIFLIGPRTTRSMTSGAATVLVTMWSVLDVANRVVDVVAEIRPVGGDGPLASTAVVPSLDWSHLGAALFVDDDGGSVSIDALFRRYTDAITPGDQKRFDWDHPRHRVTFGLVELAREPSESNGPASGATRIVRGSCSALPGLDQGETVECSRNYLLIRSARPTSTLISGWPGYLLLASAGARSRLLANHLFFEVDRVLSAGASASSPGRSGRATGWLTMLDDSAEIQRTALRASTELGATRLFGRADLIRLYHEARDIMIISDAELSQVKAMVESLDRYVNAEYARTSGRAQQRITVVGVVFAVLSTLFGTLSVLTFLGHARRDYLLWSVCTIATLVLLGVSITSRVGSRR